MTELFGHSRDVIKERYALRTPAGFVSSNLPGWRDAIVIVQISPEMGAHFCQLHITLRPNGEGSGNTGEDEWFVYVLEGQTAARVGNTSVHLEQGSYLYLPPDSDFHFGPGGAQLLVFQKCYEPLSESPPPKLVTGRERDITGAPFLGQQKAILKVLLSDDLQFDMAVNIFTYEPGGALPFVESHIMEHGLVMLAGQGIYRLDADWHPVRTNDVIWMAPYCPQWFAAVGDSPARYIYYKDVNRTPRPL